MRLVHAVTASDLQNSGHPYETLRQEFVRIGKLPIFMYIGQAGGAGADPDGVRYNAYGQYFVLPVGRVMPLMKPGEVIALGYHLLPWTTYKIANSGAAAVLSLSKMGQETLFLWSDIYPFTNGGNACFIEINCAEDLKTWTLRVNGKFVKTVVGTMVHDRDSFGFYFNAAQTVSTVLVMRDVYVAFFDPSKEKPYLGRWSCEALTVGTTEFPNSAIDDSVVDVLGVTPKVIEFTYAGTRKLESVALIGSLKGEFREILLTTLTSGSNTRETTLANTPLPSDPENQIALGNGVSTSLGSVDFDMVSKKVTAALKMQP
jgi:hypothetical protein